MATTTTAHLAECVSMSRGWRAVTTLIAATTFSQAIFAGLTAVASGRAVHELLACALVLTSLGAGLAAALTLRHRPTGRRLAGALVVLGIVLLVQTGPRISGFHGAGTMLLLHVPPGVALLGLSLRPLRLARQLAATTNPGTAQQAAANARQP